jgi:hypothetical protein
MINTLAKTLDKKGFQYVSNLLNSGVTITEKIDTFRLLFERKGNDLILYKKDNSPITLVDRTLSTIYEDALIEIPLITKDAQIPEGLFFGLYYTPVERPLRIPYSKLPKYILTDVTKRDEKGKVVESYDYESVKEWASVLCMGRPPILFEGAITDEQKKLLVAYDTKQYDGEQLTFAKMIEKAFNASYSREDVIEGIVIKSGNTISQIISYEFELLNEAYQKEHESRDFYDIVISDLNDFLDSYSIPILEAECRDQLYINIISDIFNKYCDQNRVNERIEARYLMPPQFGHAGTLNKRFIQNKDTLKHISRAPIYEALFKVFLSSFRKNKKSYGLLTEAIVDKFNSFVYLINSSISRENEIVESINESRSENIVIDAFRRRNPTDVDNMRVIASIQRAFEPKITDVVRGKTPCAVYITTFEPFTTSQMNNVTRIHNMWNCPVILFSVSNKFKILGKNFHASDDIVRAQMQALMNEDNSLIPGFGLLVSWSLVEVFQYCRPDFEPVVIITDAGKKSEMTLQLFLEEEIMGGRVSVDEKFNIGELENEDRLLTFRAIEDNNFVLLNELTPKAIRGLINPLVEEYRLWSGQVLKPIID